MGGVEPADWRLEGDRRAVIVGTIDMLLSRALLNDDCRWVFDEVQLMGPARATSAQLHGLRSPSPLGIRTGWRTKPTPPQR